MASRSNRRTSADGPTHDRKPIDDGTKYSKGWWSLEGREQQSAAWTWADERRTDQRGYDSLDLIHEAMYEGRPIGRRYSSGSLDALVHQQRAASSTLNVMQSLIDACNSRISKRRPMPVISGDNAKYSEKLYARRASLVLRRKLGSPAIERTKPLVARDAMVRGDGLFKVYRNGGDVALKRIPRASVITDDGEAAANAIRTLCHHELVHRDELMARFTKPQQRTRIAALSTAEAQAYLGYDWGVSQRADLVEVLHCYRLPTTPTAKDGRYALCVRDTSEPLEACAWLRQRFPIPCMQWTPPLRGWRGLGLIQQMAGHQGKVNQLWEDYQQALYYGGGLKVFMPRGSNIDKNHLRARHPIVIETDGGEPHYASPNPGSTQGMEAIRWLMQQMYELSGISQASAASKNPLGPNASGKALDTMYDIESDRFSQIELGYALLSVDDGMCLLDEAKDLANEKKLPNDVRLASWIKEIKWERFDFDGGEYHLVLEPENFVPDTRGGKLDTVADLTKIPGLLDPMQTAALFDEPDIAAANRHLLGPYRRMERIAQMLSDLDIEQEACTPTPYMLDPAGFAKKFIAGELANAEAEMGEDASDDTNAAILERFRWFLVALDGVEKLGNGQVAAPAGGPPMPGAAPDPNAPPPGMPPGGPLPPPMPGNGMGGLDAAAAAGMPIQMPPQPQGAMQ